MSGLGNIAQLAGTAIGTYFCPGLGTAIGSTAGKAVGDMIDNDSSSKSKNNSGLDLSNILGGLTGGNDKSSSNGLLDILG